MKYKIVTVMLLILLTAVVSSAQTSYKGLTPGKSTRSEVERVLGRPVKEHSKTLIEYGPQPLTGRIYVQYRTDSAVVERIELVCRLENSTCADFTRSLSLRLPEQSETGTLADTKWTMLYGPPHFIVMSGDAAGMTGDSDATSRMAFYSRELYQAQFVRVEEANKAAEIKAEEARRSPPPLTGGYGEITGIVKLRAPDGSLQPVANATVHFYRIDPPNHVQTKTDRHGIFQYVGLSQTATWVVVVSGPGLKWAHLDGVRTPVAGLEIIAEPGDGSVPTPGDVANAIKKN